MRHPLWLVDSTCLVFFLFAAGFAFFSQQKLPRRVKLEGEPAQTAKTEVALPIDIAQIYENDLFNTYRKVVTPVTQPDYTSAMPQPPTPTIANVPEEPKQPFLPPLAIKLQGIITIDDESNNIAIMADSKSSEQKNYRVGDQIEDARLIRILPNRVILIRSNGQQETLYIDEKDMMEDPTLAQEHDNWKQVVRKVGDMHYLVDPTMFGLVIHNIAQLIDILDLTTVYKQGESLGCRVGILPNDSLGISLGLEAQDTVTHIDELPIVTTEQRYATYQSILKKRVGEQIKITLTRNGTETEIVYTLADLKDPLNESVKELEKIQHLQGIITEPTVEEIEQERVKLLKDRYKFAPTVQDIKISQKMAMLKEGKREA